MTALRRFFRRHHGLATMIVVIALALKLLVPVGFMPIAAGDGTITVQICSGMGAATMEIAMPGLPGDRDGKQMPAKADMPCAFSGLAMPMVGGVDPLLLAVAVAFIVAIGIAAATSVPLPTPARLRPPLRGPPLTA